jgi:lysozyme family protein
MTDEKGGGLFGAPRRTTRWVRAEVTGRPDAAVPLQSDAAYLSLDLIDLKLSRAGILTSKFHALFLSDVSVATQLQTMLRQSALIDPRRVTAEISEGDASGGEPATASIVAQMPWQGEMEGEFVVLALRSEKMLGALLALNDRLAASMPKDSGMPEVGEPEAGDEGHESVLLAAIAGKVASKFVKKIGYTAAVEVARLLKAQDGTYKTRLRIPLKNMPLETGYYVMLPGGKGEGKASLAFRDDRPVPELRIDGKRANGRDYAVVQVTATPKHRNIEDVPAVGAAWITLQRVLEAGGQPDEALNAFRRVVAISPYLIATDRKRLIDQATGMVEALRPYLAAAPAKAAADDGQESVMGSRLVKFAFRTLKEAWDSGAVASAAEALITGGATKTGTEKTAAPEPRVSKTVTSPAQAPVTTAPKAAAPETAVPKADRFETALAFCFKWEGGYSDHAADRGGKTNLGVTESVYHAWLESRGEPKRPVAECTHDEARAIYWSDYWLAARCDRMKRQLDLLMFDASVNHGPGGASKLLQRALNSLGEALKVDGAIGGQTFAALARHETEAVCKQYLAERRALFQRIADKDPSQKVFLKGWLNRVTDLERVTGAGGEHSDYESLGEIVPENTPFAGYVD